MSRTSGERPVALVTGASRGIGAATARELARRGYALALAARSAEALEALAAELSATTPAVALATDLAEPAQVSRLAELVLERFGRVDSLINNAAIGGNNRVVARMDDAYVREILAINLEAQIALTRLLLPGMLERRRGAIVFVDSVAGHIAFPASTIYSATKFGLRGFAVGLRRELRGTGVSVSIVSPGFIDTDMTRWLRRFPKAPPALVGRVIADALVRPRREVFTPRIYRAAVWLERWLPWLADATLSRRGR
ncbi:MAG TPA: SDR family oxidoreductase [Roseiflexaceae bacterium]|nr:SDR family oxidoreductase [Roseiflexaceae bacterium]